MGKIIIIVIIIFWETKEREKGNGFKVEYLDLKSEGAKKAEEEEEIEVVKLWVMDIFRLSLRRLVFEECVRMKSNAAAFVVGRS